MSRYFYPYVLTFPNIMFMDKLTLTPHMGQVSFLVYKTSKALSEDIYPGANLQDFHLEPSTVVNRLWGSRGHPVNTLLVLEKGNLLLARK